MNKFLTKKNIVIFAIIAILMFVISIIIKKPPVLPKLISTTPTVNYQQASVTDPIILEFDQPIDPTLVAAVSTPNEIWDISNGVDRNTIVLKSKQYLHADTNYLLNVSYNKEEIISLKFKTIEQQGDPRYTQEVLLEMKRDYPLSTSLPFANSTFRAVYSSPLTLEITIKNPNLTSVEVIEEVKKWVKENGGDPDKHDYKIAPSATQ